MALCCFSTATVTILTYHTVSLFGAYLVVCQSDLNFKGRRHYELISLNRVVVVGLLLLLGVAAVLHVLLLELLKKNETKKMRLRPFPLDCTATASTSVAACVHRLDDALPDGHRRSVAGPACHPPGPDRETAGCHSFLI